MLKALYDYGIRNNLTIPPGFIRKNIRAYICLSDSGGFLGIELCGKDEEQICPDIGSKANGKDKCNPLAEKLSVVLGDDGKKPEYFRELLREGSDCAPCLRICLNALEDKELFTQIVREAQLRKLSAGDRISFRVDDTPIVADAQVKQWWTEYRKKLSDASAVSGERCLITGQPTTPLATLPVINGLKVVGGHSRGEALFCFDKAAFCSYGLKQSANAPVSEEAFAVVKEAMNDLLSGAPAMYARDKEREFNPVAPIYAGMKFLHWYDFSLNPDEDPLLQELQKGADDEDEDEDEEAPSTEELEDEARQYLLEKREDADALLDSVKSGRAPKKLRGEYHILLISGNNGRAMVRRYEHGSYESLQENLRLWTEDIKLQDSLGTGRVRPARLNTRLTRLVKYQNSSGLKIFEQMKNELAGLTPAILMAIINAAPLPDSVAVRALAYIRSRMLSSGDGDKKPMLPDAIACQWLKVWLIRKRRMKNEEGMLMEYYDCNFPNAAYHCGAWLAVYANLQRAAMGEVNATLVQRFYASASRTPALVFGTLERMGEIYLDELRKNKKGLDKKYEERLNSVCAYFGSDPEHRLPAILNLEGQSYFALGYRQMCTQITAEINQKAADNANKEKGGKNGNQESL